MTDAKLVKLGKKGQIVIPKVIRERLDVRTGDLLMITMEGDQIHITRPDKYAEITCGLLKGLWGKSPEDIKEYLEREKSSWE